MHSNVLQTWHIRWQIALADSFFSNIFLAAGSLLIINSLGYYRPQKYRYIYLAAWCVALSGLWTAVVHFGLGNLLSFEPGYEAFLAASMPIRFDIAFLLTGCISLISMLWYSMNDKKEQDERKNLAERLLRDAELYKLRQQLQPHFLFNSLNSISALAGKQPELARKMVQQLSDFLRGTLKKEEHIWITLEEELQHLQLYLDIEKVRFGHRLNTAQFKTAAAEGMLLPPMILQPIVENAIKFGLYDTTGDIMIRIDADVQDDFLRLEVQNPFDPETASPKSGTGFGLSSLQRRLYLLFARNDLLSTRMEGNIFITTVKIPRHDKNNSD